MKYIALLVVLSTRFACGGSDPSDDDDGHGDGDDSCETLCENGRDECIEENDCSVSDCDAYCDRTAELAATADCESEYDALLACFSTNFGYQCGQEGDDAAAGPCESTYNAYNECLMAGCLTQIAECTSLGLQIAEEVDCP